jgi:hypothetical protein
MKKHIDLLKLLCRTFSRTLYYSAIMEVENAYGKCD